MGRVEETNKALTELKDTIIEALKATSDSHAAIAHVITFHAGVSEEIAKNLAQLADDIHFLRETMAKEEEEVDFRFTPICKHFEQKEEEAKS